MFSGIIEKVAPVKSVTKNGNSSVIRLQTGFENPELGESIALNGVCLTVAEITRTENGATDVSFYVSPETISRTSLKTVAAGSSVNLERALQVSSRLSGHIVQGHVDGLATCVKIEEQSGAYLLEFRLPQDLVRYTIEKGSIALDGVSLTINSCEGDLIRIMLIPHTWTHTRFSSLKVGDSVNIEVDLFAKYTERLCQPYLSRLTN